MNRKVRVIACNKRYAKSPFLAVARWDDRLSTFITGQHIDPSVPSKGGLTVDKMTGKVALTAQERAAFPEVINPDNQHPITHLQTLNLSTGEKGKALYPRDYALYEFYMTMTKIVASGKDKVKEGTHLFYIEDKEKEAVNKVESFDLEFEAMSKVHGLSDEKIIDIALLLNYSMKSFSVDTSYLTVKQIESQVKQACKQSPREILDCFGKDATEKIFLLKLEKNGIISRKNGVFMDHDTRLGSTLDEVVVFTEKEENKHFYPKWNEQLNSK